MNISGLQKFSLLDYPGKIGATVFTSRCNFRCPFCHNPEIVLAGNSTEYLDEEDFFTFLQKRRGQLDAVCVTGGEPLLQEGLRDFLLRIRELGFLIKLDTNGSYPERLVPLICEKLVDYLAMDIKNSPERYAETTGLTTAPMEKIRKSVDLIRDSNLDYEFRTTLVREFHTEADMEKIGEWLSGSTNYYLQTFHDTGNLLAGIPLHSFSPQEMARFQAIAAKYVTTATTRE